MFKVNNKDIRMTSLTYFTPCSSIFVVNFEQVNAAWETIERKKKRVLLNRAPSSIHLHPAHFDLHPSPSTSTQLILDSTQLSATPQQYLNQNIARNWEIFLNLGRKIKNCPFLLKIGTQGILEVLIPNLDLDF